MTSADRPILITGAGGQLGSAFARQVPGAVALDRSELDITDRDRAASVARDLRPSVIVNCAAYTAVDQAEADEERARVINGDAVGALAEIAASVGAAFVTFSSDYVFDGTSDRPYVEDDPTHPINAYGRTKLLGEEAAIAAHDASLVIRTSWVISGTHDNFVATMLRLASAGRALSIVDDQTGCPTIVDDLAAGSLQLIDCEASGVVHLTNRGSTTWFELALRSVELAGLDVGMMSACTTADYPTPAARPAYSVLGSDRLTKWPVTPMPHWEDSLPGVVEGQVGRLGIR